MATINVHEAKTHLSRLLERVSAGEEIVIGKAGKPVAKLVPYRQGGAPRKPGAWRGKVKIHPGFYDDDEELIRLFEGEED
jgi:prevent-host-death family protein